MPGSLTEEVEPLLVDVGPLDDVLQQKQEVGKLAAVWLAATALGRRPAAAATKPGSSPPPVLRNHMGAVVSHTEEGEEGGEVDGIGGVGKRVHHRAIVFPPHLPGRPLLRLLLPSQASAPAAPEPRAPDTVRRPVPPTWGKATSGSNLPGQAACAVCSGRLLRY